MATQTLTRTPRPFHHSPLPPHPKTLTLIPTSHHGRRLVLTSAASGRDGGPPEEEKRPSPVPAIRWRELLSPEPENAAAVVLTAALTWAGATVLVQLALISAAILAAAVKYSFVAALLLFVLIALL